MASKGDTPQKRMQKYSLYTNEPNNSRIFLQKKCRSERFIDLNQEQGIHTPIIKYAREEICLQGSQNST